MSATVPTPAEIRAWPATVDVPTGGSPFGIKRDKAYAMVREGTFPVPVLRLGRSLRVTRAAVMAALGIAEVAIAAPGIALASGVSAQVATPASDRRSEAHSDRIAA